MPSETFSGFAEEEGIYVLGTCKMELFCENS